MNAETDKNDTGVSYPYAPLAACIKVAQAVNDLGGGKAPVSKSLLASALKEDEKSQTLQFKIGAAKVFGLIDGRSAFRLTSTSLKFFLPTSQNDKQIALIEFLERPRAFKYLVQRFDGSKLPDLELLANILHRDAGVPESWRGRIAASFINSAKAAGVIDRDNFLRVRAFRHAQIAKEPHVVENEPVNAIEKEETAKSAKDPFATPAWLVPEPRDDDNLSGVTTWSYPYKGKLVRVQTPEDLSKELWEKLNAYVQVLKPLEETKA